MSTYILLGNLTDEGAEKLRSHPNWVHDFNQELEELGVHVIAQMPYWVHMILSPWWRLRTRRPWCVFQLN